MGGDPVTGAEPTGWVCDDCADDHCDLVHDRDILTGADAGCSMARWTGSPGCCSAAPCWGTVRGCSCTRVVWPGIPLPVTRPVFHGPGLDTTLTAIDDAHDAMDPIA